MTNDLFTDANDKMEVARTISVRSKANIPISVGTHWPDSHSGKLKAQKNPRKLWTYRVNISILHDVNDGPLKQFLDEVRSVRGTRAGTPETAYYPALSNLFNQVGSTLKPKVRAVINLKNMGGGLPDGGFFTQDQFDRNTDEIRTPLAPSRGVLEVKAPSESVDDIAASLQIDKYWNRYKLVLVTNLRDWLLLGERDGKRVKLERYLLADNDGDFWHLVSHPQEAHDRQGDVFADFIARVMLHAAPMSDPQDLAWFLASYARTARHRVAHAQSAGVQQLTALKESLEGSLGVSFKGPKGDHFFQSTLVQTLFYGIFAAWVLKFREQQPGRFDWKSAAWYLHVPMIDALFAQLAQPTRLQALDMEEVLDWAGDALNRVDQLSFFRKFDAGQSVQYFYEPFLQEFDPGLRKELGVWYTPNEIVRFMVARVDEALRNELGIPDGLADPNVIVLDPCCGTGAFLVEVLRHIAARLKLRGEDALSAHDLKLAATTRLFGFELLPAPFVIAHLQLGLVLHDAGAALSKSTDGSHERAAVYLTNALTGWEPVKERRRTLPFPEFAQEREAADAVKQTRKVLVVIGNPPYNGYAGVATGEERSLSTSYRRAKQGPQPQGQGLNELYVRFYRMAEREIVERTGCGVICLISNSSWLDGASHPAMRERFVEAFDKIEIDNLNGDKRSTGKVTPTGEPDPSAFSTKSNREGIQVGTAIATLVRRDQQTHTAQVSLRDWWGRTKLEDLRNASEGSQSTPYASLIPQVEMGWAFNPRVTTAEYLAWPTLEDIFPISFPGVQTKRDEFLIDIDRSALEARIRAYFDPAVSVERMAEIAPRSMKKTNIAYDPVRTRATLLKRGILADNFVRYSFHAFDNRWIYWEPETDLLARKSPDFFPAIVPGNYFIEARRKESLAVYSRGSVSRLLCDNFGNGFSNFFPLKIRESSNDLLGNIGIDRENVSESTANYLRNVSADAVMLFFHSIAIIHAPEYRAEHATALCQDWPRIPLPRDLNTLRASASLGRTIAALFDTETPVVGVTSGTIRQELKDIGTITRINGGTLQAAEFAITAGWGHSGKDSATMPGRGKAIKVVADSEQQVPPKETWNIWLNDTAYWANIPADVWDYTMGGYQVIKKWLSYREYDLLGRALTVDEVREVTAMARRIAALIALNDNLNASYKAVKAETTNL